MPPPPAPFFCLVLCQELLLRSLERVFEQHCDCHRPNPTGDWGDGAGNAHGLVEVDVAHQPVPSLCRGVIDGVDSHIDDCRPGLEPRAFDVLGYPAGRYHNVSILQVKFRILRLGMDHSYCRVAFLQQNGCRRPHNVAPAHDHGVLAIYGDAAPLQKLNATLWRAWHEGWLPPSHGELADVFRVEAVHVLLNRDGAEDPLLIHVGGERQLDENPVNLRIRVVLRNNLEYFLLGCVFA
mmetsp:Transcript_3349/g.8276  ORF Transcript_3349/g.8276 Transcript_3349/m.8276 type:complete len:237 (+) Transcript_3349:1800-2510(+)